MSQNCAMKQLLHSAASHLPCLKSVETCQAFIIPSQQMKTHKKLKPYMTQHCGPDIIISLVCGLSQGALLIQERALDKTYGHLKSFLVVFRHCQESSAALRICYRQNLELQQKTQSTPHTPAKAHSSVKPRGINFRPITRN